MPAEISKINESIGAREYSQLRHICNGVLLNHDPKETRVIVVSGYSIYLDDSGHPVDKPYLVVGGFIAREERWIDFENPWKKCLVEWKIDFPFHATDFFSKNKNNPKLKYIVSDLVRTITNHVEAAFSIVVDMEAYKDINKTVRLEEFAGTPFALLTRALYKNVDEWQLRVGSRLPLLYFMESGTKHVGDMMDCLRDRDHLVPPIPVPKEHIACQAADLYAYSVYQTALQGGKPFDCFKVFMQKLPKPDERVDARIFRDDLMRYIASKSSVIHHEMYPDGVRAAIPSRAQTPGIDFNFSGNKKKIRRGTVGVPKDDGKRKLSSGVEASSEGIENGDAAQTGRGEES